MNEKEHLKNRIEEERRKLNTLLESGECVETVYEQSRVVDGLLEQYMDCE